MEITEQTRQIIETTTPAHESELQLSELEREQWIWTFEKLKNAEIGLSLAEKAKIFCEASTPEEIERFIQAQLDEQNIIPLAA